MNYTPSDHTFAVMAYGESEYLEDCLQSLLHQTVCGRIILCTSTPNRHIQSLSKELGLPLFINKGKSGIARDWHFAYRCAETPLVTLTHQDDLYEKDFLEKTIRALSREKTPLIAFTDYYEIRNGEHVDSSQNRNLKIKECMLLPLRITAFQKSRFVRRRILSFGNPVCCPSVTYVKENLPARLFSDRYQAALDWQAWERISRLEGSFCYLPEALMGHRIHKGSTTTQVIGEGRNRSGEDLEMFRMFWPECIARKLNRFYSTSQDGNQV